MTSISDGDDPALLQRFRGLHDAVTHLAFAPNLRQVSNLNLIKKRFVTSPKKRSFSSQVAASSLDKHVLLWKFAADKNEPSVANKQAYK